MNFWVWVSGFSVKGLWVFDLEFRLFGLQFSGF